ncbi:MAG: GntR family transcriptional regulator [Rhodospirillales bacterium]|jgi:GntR family transcriptional regulator
MAMRRGAAVAAELSGGGADMVPLYHRIYVVLLQKLTDGSYPEGRAMPGEDELAIDFGVSRVTIRKAIERLEREGLVLRQRGRGTFPLPPRDGARPAQNRILRDQISLAARTRVTILEHGVTRMPRPVAAALGAQTGAPALRIVRVRHDARSPISFTTCHLPLDLAPLVPRRRISSLPISATLAAAGLRLARFGERITATLADTRVAAHLGVDVGTALIAMTRRVEDDAGRVVELLQALYRPDRYEYRVDYTADGTRDDAPWRAAITDSSG